MASSPLIRSVVLHIALSCTLGAASDDLKPKHHLHKDHKDHKEVAMAAHGEQMMMRRDQHQHQHQHHHHHEVSESQEDRQKLSDTRKAQEVRKHVNKMVHDLLEVGHHAKNNPEENEENTETTTRKPLVSCGGHTATRCRLCTVIDPETGLETSDRGPDWCHGDCTYYDGECHTLTSYNLHVERDESPEDASTTRLIPDLLNPNITDEDKDIMDAAADRSIQEADYEAKMRMAEEKKKEEERKNKENNFIYMAITTGSGVLACCAICTCGLLLKWCCCGSSTKDPALEVNPDQHLVGADEAES